MYLNVNLMLQKSQGVYPPVIWGLPISNNKEKMTTFAL